MTDGERRLAAHQVVLVRPVGGALAVDVVLVQLQLGGTGNAGDVPGGGLHHPLAGLVPDHRVQRVGALRRGVLRVRMVDVEARAVGQDHVGGTDLVGVDHRRRSGRTAQVETAGIPQRRFHLVVPAGALGALDPGGGGIGQHRLRRSQDRVGGRVRWRRNAVFDLRSDNPLHPSSLGVATRCAAARRRWRSRGQPDVATVDSAGDPGVRFADSDSAFYGV